MLLGRFFMNKRYTLKQTVLCLIFTFLLPLQRGTVTLADDNSSLSPSFLGVPFCKDCRSRSLVRCHYRDTLSAPPRLTDHDHPRHRNSIKPRELKRHIY